MLNILSGTEPFKRLLPDETEEQRNGAEKILPIYRKKYESGQMAKTLLNAAWLRNIDSGED